MIGKLVINSECIQCGSCLACRYPFLSSASDGSIVVARGTCLEDNSVAMNELISVCPVDAFELVPENKNETRKELIAELKSLTGLQDPTREQLKFNISEYKIEPAYPSGEGRYNFKSDSAAERAGLDEFNRVMYSQIDMIILRVITAYRIKKVKPYYTAEIGEGSVYAAYNKKVEEILEAVNYTLDNKLPADFAKVSVFPDRNDVWKMLNKNQLIADEMISSVRHEFSESLKDYECYIKTDDMEVYQGSKCKDMYCYYAREACVALARDLTSAFGFASQKLEDRSVMLTKDLIRDYNEKINKVISEKIALINSTH